MNLENKTGKVTDQVVGVCEAFCMQHEICIQILEGKHYQTLYKVIKKEQQIARMGESIHSSIKGLLPAMQTTSLHTRRLQVSDRIINELIRMKGNARTVASFADRCKDADARFYAKQMETQLIKVLRRVTDVYQDGELLTENGMFTPLNELAETLQIFCDEVGQSELKQNLIESMRKTFSCVHNICMEIQYLYTGKKDAVLSSLLELETKDHPLKS